MLIRGEAGIGKSRLIEAVKEHVASVSHTRLECRSSPYFQNTALYPIIDLLQRIFQWEPTDDAQEKLARLEQALDRYPQALEETVPLLATLLSFPLPEDRYVPLTFTPEELRQKTLETLVTMWMAQANHQPVFCIVEDVHWSDPTTLEFLDLLMDQSRTAALFTLLTCRLEFEPSWSHRSHFTEVSLTRLSQPHMKQMAERVANGKRLPDEVIRELIEKTDGVPLYLEELTKAVIESGALKEHTEHYELTGLMASLAIPTTLHDSLMARLDRLASAKGVAQLGATIGRTFSYDLLEALSPLEAPTLLRELHRLVEAELVFQRGLPPQATYTFKHALVQDAAYQSQLKRTRQQVHLKIVEILEEKFPEVVETQPELLAHHSTEAGQDESAIGYWQRAGQRAMEQSAYVEAVSHLTKGLELLRTQPDTASRLHQELVLLTSLGLVLSMTKGVAAIEVEQTYTRVWELCQRVEAGPQLLRALRGLQMFYTGQGALQQALEMGEQCLSLAQRQSDSTSLVTAHSGLGDTLFYMGAFASARAHLEQGLNHLDAESSRTSIIGLQNHNRMSIVLWFLGYPDQALRWSHKALALAQELSRPYSVVLTQCLAAVCHLYRREASVVYEQAESLIVLAMEAGFPNLVALGTLLKGWALVELGQGEAGVTQLRQGLEAHRSAGTEVLRSAFLSWLAGAYWKAGDVPQGLTTLAEALEVVERQGERMAEAELYRLKGKLIWHTDSGMRMAACTPEESFQKALHVARAQQAKSLELRAATSLARLWQSQDKRQDAYDLLAPVYGWFTEGFDTADLIEAKHLLDELSMEIRPPTA